MTLEKFTPHDVKMSHIFEHLQKGKPFALTNHGQPVALVFACIFDGDKPMVDSLRSIKEQIEQLEVAAHLLEMEGG
ncbi:MAG: hypothetical protein ACXAEN_24085 [Candidatus Thorarchaeota archaeon]